MNWKKKYEMMEKKFHILIELSNDGYWDWDMENPEYQYLSPRFKEILGYEDSEMKNTPDSWKAIIDPDDYLVAQTNIKKHLENPEHSYYQIVKYTHKSGRKLDILCRGSAIFNDEGKPIRFVGTHTDLTDLKNVEHELETQRDIAEKASKTTKLFLASMSHEIRTPLNGIVGLVDLLKRDTNLTAQQSRFLEYIDRSSDTLLKLLGDILEFSKLETLNLSLDVQRINISKIKEMLYETWKTKFSDKNIKFKFVVSKLIDFVNIDVSRYLQVLNNLITNSYKYTDKGKVVVTVSMKDCVLRTKIKDTGIGIAKKDQVRILEPFERSCGNSKIDGAGLGLSICRKIVDAFGGQMSLTSKLGSGSTFTFTYKLGDEMKSAESPPPIIKQHSNVIKILAVDDNDINRMVIKEILKTLTNIEFDIASSGEEAIELSRINKYTMIFMDIVMPGMGGEKASKIIKSEQDIIVVAMTANAISGDKERYLRKMDGYISKPMTRQSLQNTIEEMYRKH